MVLDNFLYAVILTLSISTCAHPFFPAQNQRYPSVSIPRGYQPPPQPPLRFDYEFPPQGPQQFSGLRGTGNLHPPGVSPPRRQNPSVQYPQGSNIGSAQQPQYPRQQYEQVQYPQKVQYPTQQVQYPQKVQYPTQQVQYPQKVQYPTQQVQYPSEQIQNSQLPNNNNVPKLPPVVPELQKPPIVINTLIQVFLDGKNKSIGDTALEKKIAANVHKSDKVILTREFDTKTLTFVEENGNEEQDRSNLIQIKGTAVTNSTDIDKDDLASELEKELENSIPVILEELEKNEKSTPKDTMIEDKSMEMEKVVISPEEDVNIEDLEKLIREGLEELDDGEAKKQLEKEFNEVIQSSSTPPQISTGNMTHKKEKITTTFSPEIETFNMDLETSTTRDKSKVIDVISEKMMKPIKTFIMEPREETETSTRPQEDQTPEPPEMMVPEKAMVATSIEESTDEEVVTPEPPEMMVPVKAMVTESEEEETVDEDQKPTPEPPEMMIPEKAMTVKSEEIQDITPTIIESATVAATETTIGESTVIPTESSTVTPIGSAFESTTVTPTESTFESSTVTPTESTFESTTVTTIGETTITYSEEVVVTTKEHTTEMTTELTSEMTNQVQEFNEPLTGSSSEPTETTTFLPTTLETATESIKMTTLPISREFCEIPNDESDTTKGDILFLIDSSSSVGPEQFKKSLKLISQTMLNFNNIGPTGIQVSLVQYNREPFLEFSFRRHNCLSLLIDDINDTEFMNGSSNLGRALEKVMKFAFTQSRGDRSDVENILILVTDGISDDEVQHPITLSRQNGTTPIVVSTLQAKKDILMGIVEEDQNNMFNLTEAIKISIGERLAQRIKDILESRQSTEKTKSSVVATTAPTVGDDSQRPEPTRVKPSSIEVEVTASPIVPMVPSGDDSIAVECSDDSIKATFQFPENYEGTIVAKDHSSESDCTKKIKQTNPNSQNGRLITMEIKVGTCGLNVITSTNPSGIQHSIILNILHKKEIITAKDKSFILECFRPKGVTNATLETKLNVEGGPPQTKTISLAIAPPKCSYTLRRDSPNGPVIQYARIGQVIYHRWECDGENVTNSVYGLYIHDCKATNQTKHDFEIINKEGCSIDSTIVNEITYANDKLLAFAKSYVFTLTDVTTLLFSCKVSLCVRDGDGCEGYSPPVCPSSNMSDVLLTRKVRHYDEALQAALTSELNTEVIDVSDPLTAVRIHQLHLPIVMVVIVAVIIGSFVGVIWHFCSLNRTPKKAIKSGESQCTFPDDESTTDKSETLSFRSLDFKMEEHSIDLPEMTSPTQPCSETRQP